VGRVPANRDHALSIRHTEPSGNRRVRGLDLRVGRHATTRRRSCTCADKALKHRHPPIRGARVHVNEHSPQVGRMAGPLEEPATEGIGYLVQGTRHQVDELARSGIIKESDVTGVGRANQVRGGEVPQAERQRLIRAEPLDQALQSPPRTAGVGALCVGKRRTGEESDED
jgi:hypothetical protein